MRKQNNTLHFLVCDIQFNGVHMECEECEESEYTCSVRSVRSSFKIRVSRSGYIGAPSQPSLRLWGAVGYGPIINVLQIVMVNVNDNVEPERQQTTFMVN